MPNNRSASASSGLLAAALLLAPAPGVRAEGRGRPTTADPAVLIDAAREGRMREVRSLVAGGADVNTNVGGTTPLCEAAARGDLAMATYLVSRGARLDPAPAEVMEQTPLHLAAVQGDLKVVRFLVKRGAAVGAREKNTGRATPLHDAAAHGRPEVVDFLLDCGADPRAIDGYGQTPADVVCNPQWVTGRPCPKEGILKALSRKPPKR